MKGHQLYVMLLCCLLLACNSHSQTPADKNRVQSQQPDLPPSTVIHKDLVFKQTESGDLKLDIYLPNNAAEQTFPLIMWVHAGAWFRGNKEVFLRKGKNNNLANKLLKEGYAIAAISYRLSGEATFPAQIIDCNDALSYLIENKSTYHLDVSKIGLIGRSAGGHLAALMATSNNDTISAFKSNPEDIYPIAAVVDYWGVSDLIALRGKEGRVDHDADDSAEANLLGANPLDRPDLAKWASPTSYVDENTPPFFLIHGKQDDLVSYTQSILFKAYLDLAKVENELLIIEEARHGDPLLDQAQYITKVLNFLNKYIK